jgi:CubicO group peptidase (beta-lactamase class C family)
MIKGLWAWEKGAGFGLTLGLTLCSLGALSGEVALGGKEDLKAFEGRYKYFNQRTIEFAQSPRDRIFYAIIDEARYPLVTIGNGVFKDRDGSRVVFERGEGNQIMGYRLHEAKATNFFDRIATVDFPRAMWFARGGTEGEKFQYSVPQDLRDGLEVGSLRDAGLDPGLIGEMVEQIANETHRNIHSVLIIKDGKLVLEEYFYQYDQDKRHQVRSATKSVVSALVGIAIDKKLIKNKEERVLSFFPEYEIKNLSPEKRAITIEDLLTNQSGLDCEDSDAASPGNESKMGRSPDWVKFILDLPMIPGRGETGRYCSGGVIVLGRIVEKVSGKKLSEFAAENLFGKLNVFDFKWDFRPDSSSAEDFCQLHLRPRDMAKFGLLYLNEGRFNGQQVISSEWVRASLSKHSVVNRTDYGYLWWRQWLEVGGRRVDGITAKGNGGQRIYLWPEQKMVVVITGGNYNERSPADELEVKYILPAAMK